eukprot:CAMPEP_0173299324 /NCGR_PEP_ID=MMETSP1143-20121109/16612_1 /TAXON_ID=483371 /ORGANISM="non described non described, Strain CCMP2298" /LENGTH=131 /DNA_ID=CAMNT_0014239593 /DNA_START=498 /DNA_END=894 /DNA_ORIENTATION=+
MFRAPPLLPAPPPPPRQQQFGGAALAPPAPPFRPHISPSCDLLLSAPAAVYACPQRSGLHRQVCPLLHPLEHHLDLRIQQLGEQLHAQRFEVLILYVHAPMQLLQELVRGLTAADAAEQDRRRGVAGELAK